MNGPPCLEVTLLGFEFPLDETDVHTVQARPSLFILSFLFAHFDISFPLHPFCVRKRKKELSIEWHLSPALLLVTSGALWYISS